MADHDVPLIERTYRVRLPNGVLGEVRRLDLNMHRFADLEGTWDRYIQLIDGGWIRHRLLTIVDDWREVAKGV
jgi:hypothetical protein